MSRAIRPLLFALPALLFLGRGALLRAQTPLSLDQMETIYRRELSERHIPLISRYLIELQRQSAAAVDKTAWQAEIVRVQELLKSGGIIDLAVARAAVDNIAAPMPAPMPPPLPREIASAALTLSPALALNAPSATAAVMPVGQIEWRIESLPAGTYDIHLQYACPALPADLLLQAELDGQRVETVLDSARLTRDAQTFRVLKIGRITLPVSVRGKTLRFTSQDKTSTSLLLKRLFLTPAKPPPPAPK